MATDKNNVLEKIQESPVIPVYYNADPETCKAVLDACYAGGLRVFEFVYRGDKALENFKVLKKVASEKYPDLKANENFRDLQSQLEGTENRITVARQRYIASVQDYNVTVRKFPNNLTAMVFGYETKPSFTVENEKAISTAPSVDFGK